MAAPSPLVIESVETLASLAQVPKEEEIVDAGSQSTALEVD